MADLTAPRLFVPPPTFAALPYGLLSVVQPRYDATDPHWRNGVLYQPLCGTAASTFDQCVSVTGTGGAPPPPAAKAATADMSARGATPFTVYAEIDCSPVGFYDEAQSRAGDALARFEAWQVERAFWTGLAGGQPVVYPHLAANAELLDGGVLLQTAATSVTGSVLDPVEALGRLEQQLADCYNGIGVIHVPMQLVPALAARGLIVKDGARLRTWNGNRVAAGAGYPGTSPAGAAPATGTSWIYATGATFAYRSAPYVNPTPSSVDRLRNTVKVIAERTYLLGWDCCHFAALVSTGGEEAGAPNSAAEQP